MATRAVMSASVLSMPREKRTAPLVSSWPRFIAIRTWDGDRDRDEHAEPVEAWKPCISRCSSRASPSMKRNEIFTLPGRRVSFAPFR